MASTDRPRFRKIVVGFDGSKDSVRAIEMAGALAGKFESEITVVHVYSTPVIAYAGTAGMPVVSYPELEEAVKKEAQKTLLKGVQLARDAGAKAKGELIVASSTVQALAEFSTNVGADLIVVGSRGMTGFKKLILGSVSSGLVSHAACPVLVVR